MIKFLTRIPKKKHSSLHSFHLSTPFSTCSPHSNNHPIHLLLDHIRKHQLDFRIVHSYTLTSGLFQDPFTYSRLIEFCFQPTSSKYNDPHYAKLIFHSIDYPDIYTWHALILGFNKHGSPLSSISYYLQMLHRGVPLYNYTFALVLKACIDLTPTHGGKLLGKMMHAQVLKHGAEDFLVVRNSLMNLYCGIGCLVEARLLFDASLRLDLISWNSMISAYGKCGEVEAARELFEKMPERSLASWDALIKGYVTSGGFTEALNLFNEMRVSGVEPDALTLVSVLKASGNLGALEMGKWVRRYIDEKEIRWQRNVVLGTALLDMYAKCGCIDVALELFNGIHDKDVILWNAMISCLALHGHGRDALELFFGMERHESAPNSSTFVAVLSACAHSRMVDMGIKIFESMKGYGIEPGIEHYGCLADILGRAGHVREAEHILLNMSMEPQASQWGALLAACRTHNNLDVGERVGRRLISLEPHDGGRYVLLSNIYAAAGKYDNAREIRRQMDRTGAKKETGCSFIEMDGIIHEFISGDTYHLCSIAIYQMLDDLEREMKGDSFAQHKCPDNVYS